jgi:hypothetical protein
MPLLAVMIKFSITGQFIKPFMEFGMGFIWQHFGGKILNVILGASYCAPGLCSSLRMLLF